MFKNYAIGTTLLALMFSLGTSAQSPKHQSSPSVLKARSQVSLTVKQAVPDFQFVARGGSVPPNDLCTGAVPQNLAVGSSVTFSGDNTGATDTEGLTFGSVWESFTTTECSNLTLSYCGTNPAFTNAFLSLYVGCPSTGALGSSSFDQTTCPNGAVTIFYQYVPAGTWYYPVLTDVGSVGPYSITVSAVACPAGYCSASASDATFETIGNVSFAGINNSSTAAVGYENFTTIVGTAAQGSSQAITVTLIGGVPNDQVLVWIDYDQSESFEANELVYTSANGAGPHSTTINIPATATLGQTRMRIRMQDVGYAPNNTACGTNAYGQVEDYTINITSGGGGTTPPNDLCTGAVPQNLAVGSSVTFTGDNTGATDSENLNYGSVWESFTTTECSNLTLSYCGTNPAFANAFLPLYVGCPSTGALGSSSFDQTTCANGGVTIYYQYVPAGTWYYPVLTDVGSVGPYSITVSAVACPAGYCSASASDATFETIGNVSFAGINNSSTAAVGYEDFTAVVGTATQGSSQAITVTLIGGVANDQVLVWIDYDQSDSFEASELVYTSANGAGPHTATITIPSTAAVGPTRMRIRMQDVGYAPNNTACGTNAYGQVEDYTLNIDMSVGMNDAASIETAVYPNPNTGDFSVRYGANATVTMELMDLSGRLVYSEVRNTTANEVMQVQLAGDLAAGTYMLRMSSTEGNSTVRVIVK